MAMTPEQYEAYRNTDYVVLCSPPVILRIDQGNAELDALLVREGKQSAAFISAWPSALQEEDGKVDGDNVELEQKS